MKVWVVKEHTCDGKFVRWLDCSHDEIIALRIAKHYNKTGRSGCIYQVHEETE